MLFLAVLTFYPGDDAVPTYGTIVVEALEYTDAIAYYSMSTNTI